jgi:hypothetical protein
MVASEGQAVLTKRFADSLVILFTSNRVRLRQLFSSRDEQMLRIGETIRLTSNDVHRLTLLTQERPDNVKSIHDLNRFLESHVARHRTDSAGDRLMRFLLLREKLTLP